MSSASEAVLFDRAFKLVVAGELRWRRVCKHTHRACARHTLGPVSMKLSNGRFYFKEFIAVVTQWSSHTKSPSITTSPTKHEKTGSLMNGFR